MVAPSNPDHPAYFALWSLSGQVHEDMRALVEGPFSRDQLALMRPAIRGIADELVAAALAQDGRTFEFMEAIARPLTNRTICLLLDVDQRYGERFTQWIMEFASAPTLDRLPQQPEMVAFLQEVLEEHRQRPRAGVVDALISAAAAGKTVGGHPLSEQLLLGELFSYFFAGRETTASGLGNVLLLLSQQDGLLERLRADRKGLLPAIREALRYLPPFPAVIGWATRDLAFGEDRVGRGEVVTAWLTSANRDSTRFEEPQVFIPDRKHNPHLSFGTGPHRCLGEHLGLMEIEVALQAILDRMPLPIRPDPERPPVYQSGIVYSCISAHFLLPASVS